MYYRSSIRAVAVALPLALLITFSGVQAHDETTYPNLKGQWNRSLVPGLPGQPSHDQTKPWGKGQQAPLTPEYQARFEASIADQEAGGHGNNVEHTRCVAAGMPWMMVAFRPLEFVVTPDTTYVLIGMIPSRASHASSTGSNRSATGQPKGLVKCALHSG